MGPQSCIQLALAAEEAAAPEQILRYVSDRIDMTFAHKFRRRLGLPSVEAADWVAGMVRLGDGGSQMGLVTVVWLRGSELLAEQTCPSYEAQEALFPSFMAAVLKHGYPGRVRVHGAGLAAKLRRIMPPRVSIVRARTPELSDFLEKRDGVPEGTYTRELPTESISFLEVPPFERVAAEVFGNISRPGYRPRLLFLSSPALGLDDAIVAHSAPADELPSLVLYPDFQATGAATEGAPQEGVAWDAHLFRYKLGYTRDPNMTEEERDALRSAGWWFDTDEPNLRPVAGMLDEGRMRIPSDEERTVLTAAAYASIAVLNEPLNIGHPNPDARFSLVLKLDDERVANLNLRWSINLGLDGGADLDELAVDYLSRLER